MTTTDRRDVLIAAAGLTALAATKAEAQTPTPAEPAVLPPAAPESRE
jgi:hypothetical protein